MRVDPRLLLGDPALVDEALHERVVGGELGELAVAEQVAAAVADVADADPGAVEERGRGRGAGAARARGPPRPARRSGRAPRWIAPATAAEQVVVAGRLVEPAQLVDGGR